MIKIALCINQTKERNSILQEITESFEQHNIPHDILVCSDSDDLMDKTRDTFCPDILLFDMHGENGRLRQAALKQKNHKLISVVTEKTDYIQFEDNLLLQPIYSLQCRSSQLWSYLTRTYQLLISDTSSFTYYHRPEYATVMLDDILYFNSEGRKIHMVTTNGCDSFYYKLDEVEQLLQQKDHHFARIHKSYLVNTDYITEYDKRTLTLETGQVLNISRYDYYKEVHQLKQALAQ